MPNTVEHGFLNPYNFVKVDSFTPKYEYKGHNTFDGHSGCITVEMKLITPLFIGGERKEITLNNGDKHSVIDFFSVNGKPCIPSTSLKGMLRSTIETLSNSCFRADYSENEKMNYLSHRLDVSDRTLSREIQGLKPGVLKRRDNEWYFIPLNEAKILTIADRRIDEKRLFVAKNRSNRTPEKISIEEGINRYNKSKGNRCDIELVENIQTSEFKINSVNGISPSSTNKIFPYVNLKQSVNRRLFGIIRKLKERRQFPGNRIGIVELYKLKEISDNIEALQNNLNSYAVNVANERTNKQKNDRNLIKIIELDYKICEVFLKTTYDIETKTQDRVFFEFGKEDLNDYIRRQEGIRIDETVIQKFKNVISTRYDEFDKHYEHDYLFELQPKKVKDGMLVYAKFNGQSIEYLSYTRVPRKPYKYGVSDIVNRINKNPCSDLNSLCPACNMFGFVKGKNSLAGKISVSMGVITENEEFYDSVPIKTLSSPKPTFCQFYLINNRKHNGRGEEPHLTYNDPASEIGRKEYLNHSPECLDYKSEELTKFNSTIKPLKEGSKFRFKIYFQNLNNYEIGLLLYALNMRYNNQKVGFKLGMGKPLGLGSIEIEKLEVKKVDMYKKYQSLFSEYESILSEDEINGLINIYKMIQSTSSLEQFKDKLTKLNNEVNPKKYKDQAPPEFYDIGYIRELHILRSINRIGTLYTVKYPARMREGNLVGFQWFLDKKDDPDQRLFQPGDIANIILED